jgi:hypothetical protein
MEMVEVDGISYRRINPTSVIKRRKRTKTAIPEETNQSKLDTIVHPIPQGSNLSCNLITSLSRKKKRRRQVKSAKNINTIQQFGNPVDPLTGKKKRGRPEKSATNIKPIAQFGNPIDPLTGKKKLGRPVKSSTNINPILQFRNSIDPLIRKKMCGRPVKSATNINHIPQFRNPINPLTGKKKRGRPVKSATNINPIPQFRNPVDPLTGKKKRGRPKKSNLVQLQAVMQNNVSFSATMVKMGATAQMDNHSIKISTTKASSLGNNCQVSTPMGEDKKDDLKSQRRLGHLSPSDVLNEKEEIEEGHDFNLAKQGRHSPNLIMSVYKRIVNTLEWHM